MVRKFVTLVAVLALVGCATNPNKINITTDVKPIAVPIIYSPAPPVVTHPDLPFSTITSADSDGMVAKKYAASVEALIGYAEQLEDIVKQYQTIHDSYSSLASQVAADWKAKTGTDLQIPSQPTDKVTSKPILTPKLVAPPTTLH